MSDSHSSIEGKCHQPGSAAQLCATLSVDGHSFTLIIGDGKSVYGSLIELGISNRLGNIERKITLSDGSVFVTNDNNAVDRLLVNDKNLNSLLHKLESHIGWVIVALFITIVTTGAFFKWGIPWTSATLAKVMPHKTNELIASHSFEFLDDYFFEEESDVSLEKATKLREHFKTKLIPLDENHQDINYQLHFRKWDIDDKGIPNALALPSGDIILTDKFIELSQSQDEIDSVILHEMGHVAHRHTLKTVIEGTLLTTIIMIATGDGSSLGDLGLGVGSLLISSNYSRNHETEADTYAFKKMLKANIDPQAFSDIMNRMTEYMEYSSEDNPNNEPDLQQTNENQQAEVNKQNSQQESFIDYLSSHPNTKKRIQQAEHYSECFNNKIIDCPLFTEE